MEEEIATIIADYRDRAKKSEMNDYKDGPYYSVTDAAKDVLSLIVPGKHIFEGKCEHYRDEAACQHPDYVYNGKPDVPTICPTGNENSCCFITRPATIRDLTKGWS